mgnify:CR=1 FL=1
MPRRPIGRKSQRDILRENDASQRLLSAMSGKPIPEGVLSNVQPVKPRIRKPSDRVLERDVLRAIMAALKTHPDVVRVQRRTVGLFEGAGGHTVMVGSRGEPDITGLVRAPFREQSIGDPIPFEIEVKSPTGRLSEVQKKRLERSKAIGVRCGVAHNVAEAIAIIEGRG